MFWTYTTINSYVIQNFLSFKTTHCQQPINKTKKIYFFPFFEGRDINKVPKIDN